MQSRKCNLDKMKAGKVAMIMVMILMVRNVATLSSNLKSLCARNCNNAQSRINKLHARQGKKRLGIDELKAMHDALIFLNESCLPTNSAIQMAKVSSSLYDSQKNANTLNHKKNIHPVNEDSKVMAKLKKMKHVVGLAKSNVVQRLVSFKAKATSCKDLEI